MKKTGRVLQVKANGLYIYKRLFAGKVTLI